MRASILGAERCEIRDALYLLADETSNPKAMRACVNAWFDVPLSKEAFVYDEDRLVEALIDHVVAFDVADVVVSSSQTGVDAAQPEQAVTPKSEFGI